MYIYRERRARRERGPRARRPVKRIPEGRGQNIPKRGQNIPEGRGQNVPKGAALSPVMIQEGVNPNYLFRYRSGLPSADCAHQPRVNPIYIICIYICIKNKKKIDARVGRPISGG